MPDQPQELTPAQNIIDIDGLLPMPSNSNLTADESKTVFQFQKALIILGQAAGGALVCPGNQVGVPDTKKCPYAAKCEMLRLQKAPAGDLCPIERELILARFKGWVNTINADINNLREDHRTVIAELTYLDVQEQRCTNIMSRGEAARLTEISVKDSNPETEDIIAWERVIHANATLLESLHTRKRMIMKDWLITPEAKFKVAKAMGHMNQVDDLSKKLSSRAETLRELEVDVIDAEFTELREDV